MYKYIITILKSQQIINTYSNNEMLKSYFIINFHIEIKVLCGGLWIVEYAVKVLCKHSLNKETSNRKCWSFVTCSANGKLKI